MVSSSPGSLHNDDDDDVDDDDDDDDECTMRSHGQFIPWVTAGANWRDYNH